MKLKLLTSLLFLISMTLFSQESLISVTYIDSVGQAATKENYTFKRVVEYYKNYSDIFLFSDFLQSGTVAMKAISYNKEKLEINGPRIDFYENGKWKRESNYVKNKKQGKEIEWHENGEKKSEISLKWNAEKYEYEVEFLQYWDKNKQQKVIDGFGFGEFNYEEFNEKGEVKNGKKHGTWSGKNNKENYTYTEKYNHGEFISGVSEDSENNINIYNEILENPTYKGGMAAFYKFVGNNFRTPRNQTIGGKVMTNFDVDKEGNLMNIKILRDIGNGTGLEAVRVLSKSEKWIPGKKRGIVTVTKYMLPIQISVSLGTEYNYPYNSYYEEYKYKTGM